jgi:hypothetical protein
MKRRAWAIAIATCATLLAVAPYSAGRLKKEPSHVVALSGSWQLDPYRSDDAKAVLEQVKKDMENARQEQRKRDSGHSRARHGGGFPGGDRHRGRPDGAENRDDSSKKERSRNVDPDPHRVEQLLNDVVATPAQLTFKTVDKGLTISAGEGSLECVAGSSDSISDALGKAERECGWDGAAWVVETVRGKEIKRTDRYELSADGKELKFSTVASGEKLPKVEISRTYTQVS